MVLHQQTPYSWHEKHKQYQLGILEIIESFDKVQVRQEFSANRQNALFVVAVHYSDLRLEQFVVAVHRSELRLQQFLVAVHRSDLRLEQFVVAVYRSELRIDFCKYK